MDQYIFSYGELGMREVAEMNGKTLEFIPAILKAYQRNFRALDKISGFAAAGIEKKEGAEVLGMLIRVVELEITNFDAGKPLYDRIQISASELVIPGRAEIPEGTYYLYIPKNPQPASEVYPIAQSYIDVMLQPYLSLDAVQIQKLVEAMSDLDHPWVNDREMPLFSKYPNGIDVAFIDDLLRRTIGKAFEARVMLETRRIKPGLVTAIFAAIRFYNLFDFPLTLDEVRDYLYKYHDPLHIKELKATLDHLVLAGELAEIKGYYVLTGRESILEIRKTRKFIAEIFWNRTKLYGQYMRSVPFTRMIAVCNNLAYDNPSEQSDIDLFIVVKSGRMWMARFLITVILHFFGVRRYGNKIAGRFCLSFFVTEDRMAMQDFELGTEDPYLAYWTKNLRPIFGVEGYRNFCEKNREWLLHYGLSFDESRKKHMYHYEDTRLKRFTEWLMAGYLGGILEEFLKLTLKKKTLYSMKQLGGGANVIVSDEVLKFHNHDRRREFLDRWRSSKK